MKDDTICLAFFFNLKDNYYLSCLKHGKRQKNSWKQGFRNIFLNFSTKKVRWKKTLKIKVSGNKILTF